MDEVGLAGGLNNEQTWTFQRPLDRGGQHCGWEGEPLCHDDVDHLR